MILVAFLSIICLIASTLIIWFKSDAFVEWMKLFGLSKYIKYQQYLDAKFENVSITYPLFLKLKYPRFIFKLLGCPLCLGTWLSILGGTFMAMFTSYETIGLIIEAFVYSPIILIASIYIYYKISKMINENK